MTPQPPRVQTTANPPIPGGFAVVVVAAGSGTRLGQGIPKALVRVGDRTILEHCLTGITTSGVTADDGDWDEGPVVVTVPAGDTGLTDVARSQGAVAVTGGADRADSVRNALEHLRALGCRPRGVLVHDAARCLAPTEVFARVARALVDGQEAVIPVLPVVDTIRAVDGTGACQGVVDRSGLRAVQTPQGFDWDLLLAVNDAAADHPEVSVTDDASLVEKFSDRTVHTVAGDDAALKITRPLDLVLAEALLARTLNRTEPRP
ncbi:2-C-methyl-D-erythritol 4-phosphate cytidylyltransferase [Kocuria soli]|uniref:2-C-methyl-D-erythritol 4-phosphate cytidylyltransferase n=1 Tax=Kocuria soli TaxID=2485125 RepID=A0A3N4A8Y6_9MICC|nr:2-C-methyl-D-erythritol 4-phosphate cytidylyltransferase [Kocuria soli]ROZ62028.1 2-C-methyl-D-erythritol 4-phosphate cytidylyltransferase [Kocuria soli]